MHRSSVSWHTIPLKFSSWNIICLGQRADQWTILQTFECSNKSSPNSSCHFWNHKVKVYANFASLFNVMKDNRFLMLFLKLQGQVFFKFCIIVQCHERYLIPHAIFETTRSRFIQILHHCSVSWKITPVYFLVQTLSYFEQKEPIEVKFSDFWVKGWDFTKLLMLYLKPHANFTLNFASLFSVMRDNSSILF